MLVVQHVIVCSMIHSWMAKGMNKSQLGRTRVAAAANLLSRSDQQHSELLGNKTPTLKRSLIIILVLEVAPAQFHLLQLRVLVGHQAEQMRNAVQASSLLVIRAHDITG